MADVITRSSSGLPIKLPPVDGDHGAWLECLFSAPFETRRGVAVPATAGVLLTLNPKLMSVNVGPWVSERDPGTPLPEETRETT